MPPTVLNDGTITHNHNPICFRCLAQGSFALDGLAGRWGSVDGGATNQLSGVLPPQATQDPTHFLQGVLLTKI